MPKPTTGGKGDIELTKTGKWYVYKHTAPNGKVYIGITHTKPKYRWGKDGYGYRSNQHFAKAINKYGWENFAHEILFDGLTQEQAEQKETELISFYNSADPECGYNVALGGHALSKESRKKISETRKARGIKPWITGKHWSDEVKQKFSETRKGKPPRVWTDEQRKNLSKSKAGEGNANFGKPMRETCRAALLAANEKPVYKLDGETKTLYRSAKEAGLANGICNANITRCCKGQRSTAGGFKWCYA